MKVNKVIFFSLIVAFFPFSSFAGGSKKRAPTYSRTNRTDCARLYEHAYYKGKEWIFCEGNSQPSGWNDKVSSIKIPKGGKVKVCKHGNEGGPCYSYFKDVKWIGHFLNDQISWVKVGKFKKDDFTMILMSDPQIYWKCGRKGKCKKQTGRASAEKQGALTNKWHVASIKKLVKSIPFENFGGVISNGDLTAFGHSNEFAAYQEFYESRNFNINIYPGLGNHDYGKNNVNDCWENNCARRMVKFITDRYESWNVSEKDYTFRSYYRFPSYWHDRTGSLGYAVDIGQYRFVQLHNYPTYETNFHGWNFGKAARERMVIKSSMNWVKNMVKNNPNKIFVFNWHDPWGSFKGDQQVKFADLCVDRKCPVVFTGHFHSINGFGRTYTGKRNKIPVFLSGSASYNKYLKVRFQKDNITITAIDSENGGVKEYKDWHIKLNRLGNAYNGKP